LADRYVNAVAVSSISAWFLRPMSVPSWISRDAGRMGQHEFDAIRGRHPRVSGLRVQRAAVVAGLRPLTVDQETACRHDRTSLLDIAERFDRRVFARALA
jgi:hypothetical protein